MKVVDRLIGRELLAPLLNSILLFMMLLFGATYLFKVTELLVNGVPPLLVMKVTLCGLPVLLTQTLPMSMLLGTLLAFGRISGDSEHIALFASGISFFRICRPVIYVGALMSIVTVAWNETVVPPAQRMFYSLMEEMTSNRRVSDRWLQYNVKRPGEDAIDEMVTIAGGFDAKTKTLRRVTIVKYSEDPKFKGHPVAIVYAESARAHDPAGLDWTFYNGHVKYLNPESTGHVQADLYFQQAETNTLPRNVKVGRDFKGIVQSEIVDNRRMTFRELRDKINQEKAEGKTDTAGDEVDLWEKLSLPVATLIFGLVGAPMGVRPNRGSKAMGFGVAIGIIFLYWVLYRGLYVIGKSGGLPPALASFAPCIIGLIAAGLLIRGTRQ